MRTDGPILKQVFENGHYSPQQQASTLENAKRIYGKLPNPENPIASNVGIVVGKVQSGKTANVITLSALALDNGHKIVVLFLSDTNNLLTQNYERFLDTFNNIENVVVVKKSRDGDFDTLLNVQTLEALYEDDEKIIICSLKHAKHIREVKELLEQSPYKDDYALIVDDEGDDIGLNTARFDERFAENNGNIEERERSATNRQIVNLKDTFTKLGYISLTATPEANILLQDFQELAPDYCVTMEPNSGYTGLLTFHGNNSNHIIEINDFAPLNDPNGLPESFEDAFVFFIAGCIVKKQREGKRKHSMMVHPCHRIENHQTVYDKITTYLGQLKYNLEHNNQSGQNFINLVKNYYDQLMPNTNFDTKEVLWTIKRMETHLVNSETGCNNLRTAMRLQPYHLVVGGNMLDRGITIDGLAVTYMIRMARQGQADTLLQRARWFGYKESYIDLCRVYLPRELRQQFSELIEVEDSVWQFLYECDTKNLSPRNLNPLLQIPSNMRLTARQKAEYITTQLIAFAKSQSFIVHDAQMNGMNKDLIDNLNWNGASVKRYNAYQTHKQLTLSRNDFESFINSFKFSEEDTMNKDYAIALLNRLKAENVDMWYMRYETGEHRSTSDYRVNALLQGRSEGKVVTDPDYYVGDRYIKTDNLSVQIHRVFLKNDIEDQYTKGDEVYMLAFILPDNYVGGSAARRMTTDEIRNRL